MNKKLRFSIASLLWLTACIALFLIGWQLQPPELHKPTKQQLDGIVLKAFLSDVAISLNKNDGVAQGNRVVFKRNGKEIAKGVVVSAHEKNSLCRVPRNAGIKSSDIVLIER